ncbi:MAG TPA: CorA family divalent cation transporter [Dongiaceae bacterium]
MDSFTPPFEPLESGELPGLLWSFAFDHQGSPEKLDAAGTVKLDRREEGWRWLHFDLLDQRCRHWLSEHPEIDPAARGILLSSGDHQYIRVAAECLTGVLADTIRKLDDRSDDLGHWRFAMHDGLIVSAGRHALQAVETVRNGIASGAALPTPAHLIEAILDEIAADADAKVLQLAADLDCVEDSILADEVHDERGRLAHLRRRIVRLHRRIFGLLTMIHRLDHQMKGDLAVSLHTTISRVVQRLGELGHELSSMQERGRLLQEEITTKLATESNAYLQGISILTALFLPPTFIVGVFGMNTGGLPLMGNGDGFILVVLLCVICSLGAYWLLKKTPRLFKNSGMIR